MSGPITRAIQRLECLIRGNLRRRIMEHLVAHRQPVTASGLSEGLGVPLHAVRLALRDMVRSGRVVAVYSLAPEARGYRPVEIGLCEWCGLLDHHLVAGECPACAATVPDLARPAHARRVC